MKKPKNLPLFTEGPSKFIMDAADNLVPDKAAIEKLSERAKELMQKDEEIKALEKKLEEAKDEQKKLARQILPDLFDECGLDKIGVPDQLFDVVMKDKYFASISGQWPEDQREAAFDLIEEFGGGDMIATTVSVSFAKNEKPLAEELKKRLEGLNWLEGRPVKLVRAIHWGTLSSWLREMYQDETKAKIPLAPIGGDVARVCEVKPRPGAKKKG